MKKAFIAIIVAVFLTESGHGQETIGGVRWELTELNGTHVRDSRAFIEFDESAKRFSGNAGCNRMFGDYAREGTRFKAGGIGTTKMACVGKGVTRQEQAFLDALKRANKIRRNGSTLTLRGGGGRSLNFQRAEPSDSRKVEELASKKWLLRKANGKAVNLPGKAASLTFDPSRRSAHGFAGCNTFGGNYRVRGTNVEFNDVFRTLMGCRTELVTVEREFMEGLRVANRFEIRGNQLTLFREDQEILVFEGISNF